MQRHGYSQCRPERGDASVAPEPSSPHVGYIQRARPRSHSKARSAWKLYQNYAFDLVTLGYGRLDDGVMRFSRVAAAAGRARSPERSMKKPVKKKTDAREWTLR